MGGTIYELIIAASVDPSGIKSGLGRGVGYVEEFASNAERALDSLATGASLDGKKIAESLLQSASSTFQQNQVALREAFFSGALSEREFRLEGARNAEAFNASLVAGLKLLREEVGVRGSTDAGLSVLESLSSKFMDTGTKNARAYNAAYLMEMQRGMQEVAAMQARTLTMGAGGTAAASFARIGIEGSAALEPVVATSARVAAGIGRIGIGAAFAAEQLMQGGERGEGAMRRVLRATGILGLAIGGPEGILISAVALGTAALMDYFHKAEKEAEKSAEAIRKHIAGAANAGKFDDLRAQARVLDNGLPYKADGTPVALSVVPQLAQQGVRSGSLRDLEAQYAILKDIETVKGRGGFGDRDEYLKAREGLQKLIPLLNIARSTKAQLDAAMANLQSQEADNAGRATPIEVTADAPDRKFKADKTKPFADLTSDVGELTRAIDLAEQHGERAGASIYTQLIAKRAEIAKQLATQAPGSEGRNELLAADNDAMNALGLTTDKIIERFHFLRDATSAWSGVALDGMSEVQNRLSVVNAAIRLQGGLTTAASSLVREQAQLYKELDDALSKMVTHVPAPPAALFDQLEARVKRVKAMESVAGAMSAAGAPGAGGATDAAVEARQRLTESLRAYLGVEQLAGETQAQYEARMTRISAMWDELNGKAKANTDTWSALREGVQGVIDSAQGLGIIDSNLSKAAQGALHLVTALKQVAAVKAANAKESEEHGGEGSGIMGLVSTIGAGMGVIGAGISIASGIAGMLSQHDATLEKNTQKLDEMRAALVDTKGLSGQQTSLDVLTKWIASRQNAFNPTGLLGSSGNGNQGLDAALQRAGISVEQFNAIAKSLGIEAGSGLTWLGAFSDALQLSIKAAHAFSGSLDDQTALSRLRQKVYGKDDAQGGLDATLTLLRQFAPKLAAGFDGIDTTTEDGRAKLQTALQALFEQLSSGALTASDYGALGGAKDLAGIISTLVDSLTSLTKSSSAASAALLYVPSGYKVALARFNAQDAQAQPKPVRIGATDTGGMTNGTPSVIHQVQGTDGQSGGGMTLTGDIYIDAKQQTGDELFASVLKTAQRKAILQFGRSDKWSDVQA